MTAKPRKSKKKGVSPASDRVDPSAGWTRSETYTANGRSLERGTEVSIRGERGRFRFLLHTVTEKGVEWVDVMGGPKGAEKYRSFRPDRIRTVHRIQRTRANHDATVKKERRRAA
jgi:hypothetical protein